MLKNGRHDRKQEAKHLGFEEVFVFSSLCRVFWVRRRMAFLVIGRPQDMAFQIGRDEIFKDEPPPRTRLPDLCCFSPPKKKGRRLETGNQWLPSCRVAADRANQPSSDLGAAQNLTLTSAMPTMMETQLLLSPGSYDTISQVEHLSLSAL